jgi:hypothetical protein
MNPNLASPLLDAARMPTTSTPLGNHFSVIPPPLHPAPNEPVGSPLGSCASNLFRVWSLNVNGLTIKYDYAAWRDLCASLVPHGPGAIALSEPNCVRKSSPSFGSILAAFG